MICAAIDIGSNTTRILVAEPKDGQTWRSALDGAELIYQPPLRMRVGCSDIDRKCLENEIYFRWVDLPGFWIESTAVCATV